MIEFPNPILLDCAQDIAKSITEADEFLRDDPRLSGNLSGGLDAGANAIAGADVRMERAQVPRPVGRNGGTAGPIGGVLSITGGNLGRPSQAEVAVGVVLLPALDLCGVGWSSSCESA